MESDFAKDFAEKIRFHLSKEELETQMQKIHERFEHSVADSDAKMKEATGSNVNDDGDGDSEDSGVTIAPTRERKATLAELIQSTREQIVEPKQEAWLFKSMDGFYIPTEHLKKLPIEYQERLLVRDIIYACTGVPSSHIKPDLELEQIAQVSARDIGKVRFRIDEAFSGVFRALANELLPLISYYIGVQSFIEETNMTQRCGLARQALASALQDYMQGYYELQSALETELQLRRLSLQQLIAQLRPVLAIMEVFAQLAMTVRHEQLNSAQLLSLLDELCRQPRENEELDKQLEQLLAAACQSYLKIVQLWTQKGVIYDPLREFFVEDTERSKAMSSTLLSPEQCCPAYWATRYRLHPQRLPSFLVPQAEAILLSGKYLNILRQCNAQLQLLQLPLSYAPNDASHEELLRRSYELPAGKLLEVLLEQQLLQHLRNVRGFLLLQRPDFVEALLLHCSEQLPRDVERIVAEKLQPLLHEALNCCEDPHKELLHCQLMRCDVISQLAGHLRSQGGQEEEQELREMELRELELVEQELRKEEQQRELGQLEEEQKELEEQLEPESEAELASEAEALTIYGYEALTLRYEAKWPISLLIDDSAQTQLQLLQRVLLFLRYVQRQLAELWQLRSEQIIETTRSCVLRQRMLSSMLHLEQYMQSDVIEPKWQALLMTAEQASNIDELETQWRRCLELCLSECLLAEADCEANFAFVRALFTLGHVCLNYCGFVEAPPGGTDYDAFERDVGEYEEEFGSFVLSIMELVGELAKAKADGESCCLLLLQRLESVNGELGEISSPASTPLEPAQPPADDD